MPKKTKPFQEMINFYELPQVQDTQYKHQNPNFNLTQIKIPFRMACIALSGGGKSNFLMNLIRLFSQGDGTFSHIHIVHKLEEDLYDLLANMCKDKITFYKKLSDLPEPKDLDGDGHQLIVFDDCITEKQQQKIENYYIYGRKINGGVGCSCIYLSQRYFAIPKTIRCQLNYIILLKIRGFKDLRLILNDCNLGLQIEELQDIYKSATEDEMSFLKIDVMSKDGNKMLSKNFTQFYEIE
jgi:hypothetical protein